MKLPIPLILSWIGGICCTWGQLGPSGREPASERRPGRVHAIWTVFVHPQYGYALPIPPGVSSSGRPEEHSETTFHSADGSFLMSAWGGAFQQSPAEVIAAQWDLALRQGGRDINYQRRGSTWFVVSGTDREGIEYYEKFTLRGQHAAFLSIQFPRSQMRQFERWVEEIEDGFGLVRLQGGGAAQAPQLLGNPRDGMSLGEREVENRQGVEAEAAQVRKITPGHQSTDRTESREIAPPRRADGSAETSTSTGAGQGESSDAPDSTAAQAPPFAQVVDGKPGFVYSPFHPDRRLVDVKGIPSGKKVKCPYTLKIFRVP